jgi:CDP-paratose 2-epimerase
MTQLLITGICGFVGRTLAESLLGLLAPGSLSIVGIDNLSRAGSWQNRESLIKLGIRLLHGDVRLASDLQTIGPVDWVIDAAATPSVLAGVDGTVSSRQLIEHNLVGTINVLELCKEHRAGFVLLSTSRVYSIEPLARLQVRICNDARCPVANQPWPSGLSPAGVSEQFSTTAPISLYGASKLASETLALEYGATFDFPVWINRCGVLAGAGQFGKADQGIFSFWIDSWLKGRPLQYIGFDGSGHQVRDALHPRDLAPVLLEQMRSSEKQRPRICNFGGGLDNSMSLAQLSDWCTEHLGPRRVGRHPMNRPFDVPWLVMDCALAKSAWNWSPKIPLAAILDEISNSLGRPSSWADH